MKNFLVFWEIVSPLFVLRAETLSFRMLTTSNCICAKCTQKHRMNGTGYIMYKIQALTKNIKYETHEAKRRKSSFYADAENSFRNIIVW